MNISNRLQKRVDRIDARLEYLLITLSTNLDDISRSITNSEVLDLNRIKQAIMETPELYE